jgi:hypothetical protein
MRASAAARMDIDFLTLNRVFHETTYMKLHGNKLRQQTLPWWRESINFYYFLKIVRQSEANMKNPMPMRLHGFLRSCPAGEACLTKTEATSYPIFATL